METSPLAQTAAELVAALTPREGHVPPNFKSRMDLQAEWGVCTNVAQRKIQRSIQQGKMECVGKIMRRIADRFCPVPHYRAVGQA